MNISLVVPCYRSEATLPKLVERSVEFLRKLVDANTIGAFEVILVVDGSVDGTDSVAVELESSNGEVSAVLLRRNFGQHNALVAGIRRAQYDIVVTLDDDLQHPPPRRSRP